MSDGKVGVVFVHGFLSGPAAWTQFVTLMEQDPELDFAEPLLFQYATPKLSIHPFRKIPTYEVIADKLAGYIDVDAAEYDQVVLVTHSQGGLIVQRYLHRVLSEGRGLTLRRIKHIMLFACPNHGSDLLLNVRRKGFLRRNPQESQLRPLNEAVAAAHRTVVNRVLHADEWTPTTAPIPITTFGGEQDAVVTGPSPQGIFPDYQVLPGDHSSVIRPTSLRDSAYLQLKAKLRSLPDEALQEERVLPEVTSARHRSLTTWHRHAFLEPEELIHVDHVIDEVIKAIESPSSTSPSAVAVSGAGGLGKTAVTYAAVERVAAEGSFSHVVWASARNTRFSAADATTASVNAIYWHDLLRMIAEQLDCPLPDAPALWETEVRTHLEDRLSGARVLVVVDNLEVVAAADQIIEQLRALGLARPHKVIATTRHSATRDDLDVHNIIVQPLGQRESYNLVRLMARGTNSDLAHATNEDLEAVFALTEGNPFLIKLISRRYLLTGASLPRIMDELGRATALLGRTVRSWLFEQSLDELALRSTARDASRLLFSFCANGRGGAMTYDALRNENASKGSTEFDQLLESACRLGLVRSSDQNRRYSIHSLLYEHTCPIPRRNEACQ